MNSKCAEQVVSKAVPFAKGKHGTVYFSWYDGREVVIKIQHHAQARSLVAKEWLFNKKAWENNLGPEPLYKDSTCMIRSFVEGVALQDFMRCPTTRGQRYNVLKQILCDCRALESAGVYKPELTHPTKDILIQSDLQPVFIDFERCRFQDDPNNVTQFVQYITRFIPSSPEPIYERGKKYASEKSDATFTALCDAALSTFDRG